MKVLIVAGRWASAIEESPSFSKLDKLAEVEVTLERDQDVIATKAADADIIITGAPITGKVINNAKKLRLIQTTSVGFDTIDMEAASANGVALCNVAGANANSVAELVFGLILNMARRITAHNNEMKKGQWYRFEPESQVQIRHKTLGIIGLGEIGSRVAQIGYHAFKLKILANDPYVMNDRADQFFGELVDLTTLLKESDIITVHVPLNDETKHIVGEKEFNMMKPTTIFINTSRGPTVDQEALIKALKEKRINGAGLDVFEIEPLPTDSQLLGLDNVVMTPHIGSTPGALEHMLEEALGNVIRVVQGKEPLNNRIKTLKTYYTSEKWN
jgi:D-3-phosphoglycerate dehydrogenase